MFGGRTRGGGGGGGRSKAAVWSPDDLLHISQLSTSPHARPVTVLPVFGKGNQPIVNHPCVVILTTEARVAFSQPAGAGNESLQSVYRPQIHNVKTEVSLYGGTSEL